MSQRTCLCHGEIGGEAGGEESVASGTPLLTANAQEAVLALGRALGAGGGRAALQGTERFAESVGIRSAWADTETHLLHRKLLQLAVRVHSGDGQETQEGEQSEARHGLRGLEAAAACKVSERVHSAAM